MNLKFDRDTEIKIRLIGAVVCTVVGFYLFFKYLFVLIWPLVLGGVLAVLLYPIVNFMHRQFKLNKIVGIILVLLFVTVLLGMLVTFLVEKVTEQILLFADNYEYYEEKVMNAIDYMCCGMENMLHIREGCLLDYVNEGLEDFILKMQRKLVQMVIGTPIPAVKSVIDAIIAAAVVIVMLFLLMKDMDKIRKYAGKSVFGKELRFIYRRCLVVGRAYLKAQLIIMTVVAVCSVTGLTISGNRYAWILGIMVGVLDALPLLGAGVVLLPLTLVWLIQKEFVKAAIIFTTFIVCYFAREYLEPKLMGDKIGVNPIFTFAGIYVGYQLFGFLGMFAGVLAVIFVMDVIKYVMQNYQCEQR